MTGLREWLTDLHLEAYFEMLSAERVDLDVLPDLSERDLADLGIPLGDRKRMMRGIARLRGDGGEPPSAPSPVEAFDSHLASPVLAAEAELRHLTLLFSDLVGSTHLATTLDLELYREAIRAYQLCCADLVRRHFGFVAQFLGDGVVAYFGYPRAGEDDAARAVAAGLEITRQVAQIRVEDDPALRLAARVGVATGEVLIGDLTGESRAMKDSVLGKIPNLAARLQSLAEPGQVVISHETRELLGGQFSCRFIGARPVKGFDAPQDVWLVEGMKAGTSRFSARARGPMTPIVGREDELAILKSRWNAAQAGEGQVVLLSGEAGIGKSRLGRWLCDTLAGEPHYRLTYHCSPFHTGSAFHPMAAQLARAGGISAEDPPDVALDKLERLIGLATDDVATVAPLFAHLLAIPFEHRYGPLGDPPDVIRERTGAALLDQLFSLAAQQPTLVFMEDIHWIDPSSRELLDLLVEQIADHPAMLLCTCRPEHDSPWVGRAGVTHLSLARLDRRRALELVGKIGGDALPPELTDQIVERTDGVPLFLEEMTRTVIEKRRGGEEGFGREVALPATLKDLLLARLDAVSGARQLVPICAALGRTFSYRLLSAVAGLEATALDDALGQLARAQILVPRGEIPQATYTFRHALIQEAAYETMLASRARALHARIATVLESGTAEPAWTRPELIAHHLSRAGRPRRARDAWRQAAELARNRSANLEACVHLRQALAENARLDDPAERATGEIALREMLREPLELCGWGSEEIEANLRRLFELREAEGDDDALFSIAYGAFGTHLLAGRIGCAEVEAARLAEVAARTGDAGHAFLTLHCRAFVAFLAGRLAEAAELFEREIAGFDPVIAARVREHYVADPAIVARVMQAWALALLGTREGAEARAAEARAMIGDQVQAFSRAYGLTILASLRQTLGEAEEAGGLAEEASAVAREERIAYWEAWAEVIGGWAMVASGSADDGLSRLREGLAAYARTGARQMLPYGHTVLADACLRAGRAEEGLAALEAPEAAEAEREVRFFQTERRRVADALHEALAAA